MISYGTQIYITSKHHQIEQVASNILLLPWNSGPVRVRANHQHQLSPANLAQADLAATPSLAERRTVSPVTLVVVGIGAWLEPQLHGA